MGAKYSQARTFTADVCGNIPKRESTKRGTRDGTAPTRHAHNFSRRARLPTARTRNEKVLHIRIETLVDKLGTDAADVTKLKHLHSRVGNLTRRPTRERGQNMLAKTRKNSRFDRTFTFRFRPGRRCCPRPGRAARPPGPAPAPCTVERRPRASSSDPARRWGHRQMN